MSLFTMGAHCGSLLARIVDNCEGSGRGPVLTGLVLSHLEDPMLRDNLDHPQGETQRQIGTNVRSGAMQAESCETLRGASAPRPRGVAIQPGPPGEGAPEGQPRPLPDDARPGAAETHAAHQRGLRVAAHGRAVELRRRPAPRAPRPHRLCLTRGPDLAESYMRPCSSAAPPRKFSQCRPIFANIGPDPVEIPQTWAQLGRNRAESGRRRADFDQMWAKLDRRRSKLAWDRSNLGRLRPSLTIAGSISTDFDQVSFKVGP